MYNTEAYADIKSIKTLAVNIYICVNNLQLNCKYMALGTRDKEVGTIDIVLGSYWVLRTSH